MSCTWILRVCTSLLLLIFLCFNLTLQYYGLFSVNSRPNNIISDVAEHENNSSHTSGSTEEHKVEENKSKQRELELDLLWPYPQQLTLIKGGCYFPEAYLSINILTGTDQSKCKPPLLQSVKTPTMFKYSVCKCFSGVKLSSFCRSKIIKDVLYGRKK